jgi:hypothetical protein
MVSKIKFKFMNPKLTFPLVATSEFIAVMPLGRRPYMMRIRAVQPFIMPILPPGLLEHVFELRQAQDDDRLLLFEGIIDNECIV